MSIARASVDTVAILGATATGKSELALDLVDALAVHGVVAEVIGADAMQRYVGMDIGTAKLPVDERRGVPHHEIDVLDPLMESAVRDYQRTARAAAAAVRLRGHLPIYVGGSGLYMRAALDELDIPPTDEAVRATFEDRLKREGGAALHRELNRLDPGAAAKIDAANTRRVVRALEVIELTGRPFSATRPEPVHHRSTVQLGLHVAVAELDERIDLRAERMLRHGLVEETRQLLHHGMGRTARRATGYAQAAAVVSGAMDLDTARTEIALATRRLARRQNTWFRPDERTHWLDATGVDGAAWQSVATGAERIVRRALGG